jgi:hypothetical protein
VEWHPMSKNYEEFVKLVEDGIDYLIVQYKETASLQTNTGMKPFECKENFIVFHLST